MKEDVVHAQGSFGLRAGGALREEAERRCQVTLMFSDLSDYTKLSESIDPEDINLVRRRVERLARQVIRRHQGQINQFVGDGVLAVFGLESADEDGVRKAIDAALELHERVNALKWDEHPLASVRVALHTGIHAGLVFARRGDRRHGDFELTGDALNTASRLCTNAERGQILISKSALQGFEAFFEVTPPEPLQLKGKEHPVLACRVLGRTAVTSRYEARTLRGLTPFVGRAAELELLTQGLRTVGERRGEQFCVVGDAGVGKTRLLDEFRQRANASGVRVLRGSSENYGAIRPLQPFLSMLRELLPVPKEAPTEQRILAVEQGLEALDEGLRVHLPAFLQLLSIKPWSKHSRGEHHQSLVDAVAQLLLESARQAPLLLILDDWQWADQASRKIVAALTSGLATQSLLLLLGTRNLGDDTLLSNARVIELSPFTEEESHSALSALLPGLSDNVALGLHHRSGGNALFLEELCGTLPLDVERDWDGKLPTTVTAVIRARCENLPERQAALLGVAAVIGNEPPRWLLEAAFHDASLDSALQELEQQGLLYADQTKEGYRFKHGLTREVVYESMRLAERRRLHRIVAESIERRYAGPQLAEHYEWLASHHAGAAHYRRAFEFAELAGDKAAAIFAFDRAQAQYAAALAHLDELTESPELRARWLEIVAKWSATCLFNPAAKQLEVLRRATEYARELNDHNALGLAEYWSGWICYALGEQERSIEHSKRALALLRGAGNETTAAQVEANLGQSYAAAGAYAEALGFLDRYVEDRRTRQKVLGGGFAYALGCRALVHADRGAFNAAHLQLQEALEVARARAQGIVGSLLCLLGMVQLWQGRFADARETAARCRSAGERMSGVYVLSMSQMIDAVARLQLQPERVVVEELELALLRLERRGIHLYLSFGYGYLAEAWLALEESTRARDWAERARRCVDRGDPLGHAPAERVMAVLNARAGDRDLAEAHQNEALLVAARRDSPRERALTELLSAQLHQAWGDPERAASLCQRARLTFEDLRVPHFVARANDLLAELNAT